VCFQSMLLTNFLSSLRMLKVNIQIILLYFGYQFTSFKFLVTHKLAPSMYLGLYNTLTMCSRFNVNQLLTECCKQNTKLCRGQVCDLTSNDFCTFLIYVHLCPSEVCISVLGHIQSKNFWLLVWMVWCVITQNVLFCKEIVMWGGSILTLAN
jgi:hypothetical protein